MQHAFDIFVNIRDGMATEAVVSPSGSQQSYLKPEAGCRSAVQSSILQVGRGVFCEMRSCTTQGWGTHP